MNNIEQKALELYPVDNAGMRNTELFFDTNSSKRAAFIAGANYALELAADTAKVAAIDKYTGKAKSIGSFDSVSTIVGVDKNSILDLLK